MAPTKRFENLDEATKTAILDAAAQEFATVGYDNAAVVRVAESVGISKGSIYYYFEDKIDLYVTVMRRGMAAIGDVLGGLASGKIEGDFWPEVEKYIHIATAHAEQDPILMALAQSFHHLSATTREASAFVEFMQEHRQFTMMILEQGQQQGAIRDDMPLDLLAEVWLGMDMVLDRWAIENWETFSDEERLAYTDKVIGLLKRIFAPLDLLIREAGR